MAKNNLTITAFKELWKTEFLPSIRNEFKQALKLLNDNIKALNDRCTSIEDSQKFIGEKYDIVLSALKDAKKQVQQFESRLKNQEDSTSRIEEVQNVNECNIDDAQQYLRRDCIEITGIPVLPNEQPKQLVKELCSVIGVSLKEDHISTAHRLPDTKKVKDRLIVKFTHRDKREEVYKCRSKLKGKSINDLPTIKREIGKSVGANATKVHINESLTSSRKKLFSAAYKFKKDNNFKFIWTNSGKILLRENESSEVFSFTNMDEFDNFKN